MQEAWVPSLGGEDRLEKETANHPSLLAWEIPPTEEPGGLQPGGRRVRWDLATEQQLHEGFQGSRADAEAVARRSGLKAAGRGGASCARS